MLIYVLINWLPISTVVVGMRLNAAVILAVVVFELGIGPLSRRQSRQSLQAIAKLLTTKGESAP